MQLPCQSYYTTSTLLQTKYFALGNYEEEIDETSGITTKYYYISGGNGLAAIYKQAGSASGTMYYVHKDHLGSIDLLTDNNGNVAERYSYDAWGNRRNPTNWQLPDVRANLLISRGYTTQEHLDVFGLINLNGRMYEPLTARFLSPDNYVQAPGFSQSFNRYGYAWNNPLSYTDPDGEFVQFIIGGVIGGFSGWMMADALGYKGWDKFGYTLGGAAIGAATAGIGTVVSSSSSVVAGGVVGGAAGGAGFGTMGGYAAGLRGGDLFNAGFNGMWKGVATGLAGSFVGGAIGGGWGALAGGATAGGLGTLMSGGSGEDVLKGAALGGVMGLGVYHVSLAYSYHASGIKSTGLKYNQYARMMRLTQRSMFWNREGKFIPNSKGGVNFCKLGERNSTPGNGPDHYIDALFEYHTHQEFGYDHFSTEQESIAAYGVPDYSDEITRSKLNLTPFKFKEPMFLGTREGYLLYMNSDFSRGFYTQYNFSHIFTPFNLTWSLTLIQ